MDYIKTLRNLENIELEDKGELQIEKERDRKRKQECVCTCLPGRENKSK